MHDYRAPPHASALIESMRDIGYSFSTALADIIDNSITANSSIIEILCDADRTSPVIAILDDGQGMTEKQLIEAMRPGSTNPLDSRKPGDLGRFGLGMKTASFSQCRRLTVITRKHSKTSAARWDLDYVSRKNDWLIQRPDPKEIDDLPFIGKLGHSGTLVLWENLDRLTDHTQKTTAKDHLFEQLDLARRHLELVFHRFLNSEKGLNSIDIKMNGRSIEAFDPFHSTHKATQHQPKETIKIGGARVVVQSFVLPHHKKVSKSDWAKYAGDGGYLKNQGFYVYRSGRLIIHGTWFRLIPQSELTKLARVQVDMPTALDHLWKIDVKKASAAPPLVVRQRLKAVIDNIAGASNRVYTAKGAQIRDANLTPFWIRRVNKNEISYELNRSHPTFSGFAQTLDDQQARRLEAMMAVIERSFPVDALFSDVAGKPEHLRSGNLGEDVLKELIGLTVPHLRDEKLSDEQILDKLKRADPYKSNWEVAEKLITYELGDSNRAR